MKTLRQQFNDVTNYVDVEPKTGDDYYKLKEIAKQMDALLEECAFMLRHGFGVQEKIDFVLKQLKQAGYGNDTDR